MKNHAIEISRFVMCLWVVLFHYTTRFDILYGHSSVFPINFENGGLCAVAFFFMISGYYTGCKLAEVTKLTPQEGLLYFLRKVKRLHPAYFVSVIIISLSLILFGLEGRDEISFHTILVNIVTPLHPGIKFIDTGHWYVASLYIAIFIIVLFSMCAIHRNYWIIGFISLCLYIFCFCTDIRLIGKLNSVFFIDRFAPFLWGYTFALAKTHDNIKWWLLLCVITPLSSSQYSSILWSIIITGLFILLMDSTIINIFNEIKYVKVWSKLGAYTYTWYLIHQNIGYQLICYMEKNGLNNEYFLLIPVITTFTIAIILEETIIKLIQKLIK